MSRDLRPLRDDVLPVVMVCAFVGPARGETVAERTGYRLTGPDGYVQLSASQVRQLVAVVTRHVLGKDDDE